MQMLRFAQHDSTIFSHLLRDGHPFAKFTLSKVEPALS
jgi:hypothetical protein